MGTVAIIDYDVCNLDSIARAVGECGGAPVVTDEASAIADAERIILPGVGAFPDAMRNIREKGLETVLDTQVRGRGVPLLGVCLGMQLLATRGLEVEETAGFGWIDAEVHRLEPVNGERIPHIGWNEVDHDRNSPLLADIEPSKDFYFVHSYHMVCADPADVIGTTPYCGAFASVVRHGNVYGTQFHPEKSQKTGFQLLRNFLSL